MTIPSRPAPAIPQPQQTSQQNSSTNVNTITVKLPPPPVSGSFHRTNSSNVNTRSERSSVTRHFPAARYAPATNWDGSPFDLPSATNAPAVKRIPPPRPPPPRISPNTTGNTVLKKPGPPQSINVLSNLFGRKKGPAKNSKPQPSTQQTSSHPLKLNVLPNASQNNSQNNRFVAPQSSTVLVNSTGATCPTEMELIKFDSPASSPTFTQKSNSDCVSVDSFSSDSNFSSPQNGSVSQAESGFEDDFLSPSDPWDAFNSTENSYNAPPTSRAYGFINDIRMTQPVRNLNVINRSQNENPLCNGKSLIPPQESLTRPTIIKPKPSLYSASNFSSPLHAPSEMKTQIQSGVTSKNMNDNFANFAAFPSFDEHESSPPMPNCPPPPPPSSNMLDVISGRLDAMSLCNSNDNIDDSVSYGIALYDFEGTEDGDLSFKENEKVYVLQQLSEGWYLGRNRRGCEGIFPSNYIEIRVPLKDDTTSGSLPLAKSISPAPALYNPCKVRVLFNFNGEVPEDLTLKENDIVTVLFRINDDWLFGEVKNQRGQFPANFLEYVPEHLPKNLP